MRRGRGRGKKVSSGRKEDATSVEVDRFPLQKGRGRYLKSVRDEEEDAVIDETVKKEYKNDEHSRSFNGEEEDLEQVTEEGEYTEKKRKRLLEESEKNMSAKEENWATTRSNSNESMKSNGFCHSLSRRKSKPRRAAEAGVDCN